MFYKNRILKKTIYAIVLLIVVNMISQHVYKRFDFTADGRYTLSETTLKTLKRIDSVMYVDVYLEGKLPPDFSRLRKETQQILQDFSDINSRVKFNFINPLEKAKEVSKTLNNLLSMGLTPTKITVKEGASISQRILLPWALISYKGRTIRVKLLKDRLGSTRQERISESIRQLEYAFTTVFIKILSKKKRSIAILKGNGELDDIHIADFLAGLKESYRIAPFTLDSVSKNPQGTLDDISHFDMTVVIKPTKAFSDKEKQVLDQYVMKGGRLLLMIDQVHADLDSLLAKRQYFAFPNMLNIDDMLFKYGVRVNPYLVKDLSFTNVVLAEGQGPHSTYHKVPWLYAPLVASEDNHPINRHVAPLRFNFANDIDTIANDIHKKILLRSSKFSKLMKVPREIKLEYILQKPDKTTYNVSRKSLAVLLEGQFLSVYKNRVKPFVQRDFRIQSTPNRMIIIADGDIAKNQLDEGKPLMLGFDKWTNRLYGNRDFLMNCVNYLLGDTGLMSVRSKVVEMSFLDKEKVYEESVYWKFINTVVPLMLVGVFCIMYFFIRKRMYTK